MCYAAFYYATKKFVLNNTLNTDDMVIIQSISSEGFNLFNSLMRDVGHIRKFLATLRSIYSTLDTESLIPPFLNDNLNKSPAKNISGKIEFKMYFSLILLIQKK